MQYKLKLINEKILEFKELYNLKKIIYYRDLYKKIVEIDQNNRELGGVEFSHHVKLMAYKEVKFNEYDDHWFYVSAFVYDGIRYSDYVKLYVPTESKDMTKIAMIIFDFIFARKKALHIKLAKQSRRDNICVWVLQSECEVVLSFINSALKDFLLPSPLLAPEYKSIGITRETCPSYNQIIAVTLYKYLSKRKNLSFVNYVAFLEEEQSKKILDSREHFSGFSDFDREVVLRSLKCILYNECPVNSEKYEILNYCNSLKY